MNLNEIDITKLGYRWKGIYSSAASYIDGDVVFKEGGARVYRNGAFHDFALGQQDLLQRGHILTASGSVGGMPGMSLHMNAAGDGVEFRFSNDRNGTVAVGLLETMWDSGPKQHGSDNYMMAIMSDGSVRGWGRSVNGYLGMGAHDARLTFPGRTAFPPGTPRINKVVSGRFHNYYIDAEGGLWFSGTNNGNLMSGCGLTGVQPVPVKINGLGAGNDIGANTKIVDVFVGIDWYTTSVNLQTMALDSDGRLYAWGYNANGCLGVNGGNNIGVAKLVPFTATTPAKAAFLSGGYYGAAAIVDVGGGLWSCGADTFAPGSIPGAVEFRKIDMAGRAVKKVTFSQSDNHVDEGAISPSWACCVICEDGNVFMNHNGALAGGAGIGVPLVSVGGLRPLVTDPFHTNVEDMYMAHGAYPRAFALMKDGTVQFRGFGSYYANGIVTDVNSTTWATIGGSYLTGVRKLRVKAGQLAHTAFALRNDGRMVVWGRTVSGLRGTGENPATDMPGFGFVACDRPILDFSVTGYIWQESEGQFCAYGLTDTGHVVAWGNGSYYQTGDDDTDSNISPSPIRF